MNWAIWKKAVADAWLHLLLSSAALVLFAWVFVWMMSKIPNRAFGMMLRWFGDWVEPLLGVPLADLAGPVGQISLLYVHVVTILVCMGWAAGRGSDPISGEIGRGTMDLIVSLPVRRAAILVAPFGVAVLGAVVLPGALLLGTHIGLLMYDVGDDVSTRQFLPGAINVGFLIVCMTGVTVFISSWTASRWRAISLAAGFYVISEIAEMVSRLWEQGSWLRYCSIASAFQPHLLILKPEETGLFGWSYNLPLLALGLVAYAAGAVVFSYRDIPVAR